MQLGRERVGPRGLLLLVLTGVLGLVLAFYGYGRGIALTSPPLGTSTAPAPSVVPTSSSNAVGPRPRPGSSTSGSPTSATGSPTSTTGSSAPATTGGQKQGPLLSSTQYAPYAYQLYPGPQSEQARLATAGFNVKITPTGPKITVSVSASGSSQPGQTAKYPASDHVYFIEATFGDDSGDADYNYGDDGVLVTDSTGHLVG